MMGVCVEGYRTLAHAEISNPLYYYYYYYY